MKLIPRSFTSRYNLTKLVYYEGFESVTLAIAQEKYVKGKRRSWKVSMINARNPEWKDLSAEILFNQDLLSIFKSKT